MWTQKRIANWADTTFGVAKNPFAIFSKTQAEFNELIIAVDERHRADICKEAADVLITLYHFVNSLGGDLDEEVDKKMEVNVKRVWKLNGDGTGQHV